MTTSRILNRGEKAYEKPASLVILNEQLTSLLP
jgi:hypothetical protein